MADVMQIIKQTNNEIRVFAAENKIDINSFSNKDEILKYGSEVAKIASKNHQLVANEITIEFFMNLLMLDMQFNFSGGSIASDTEDTVIKLE